MLINPITKKWMDGYIKKPKITLLIDCSGDITEGQEISNFIYRALISEKGNPPITIDTGDKKSIGVDDIRELKHSLTLRANKKDGISRFVVIDDASKLTVEAQNSLLKIVEELPANTLIVMIASDINTIIQTVRSRCFTLPILPITKKQAIDYAKDNNIDEVTAVKMYNLSQGSSNDFMSLLEGSSQVRLKEIELAKKFLSSSVVDRQSIIESVTQKDHDPLYFLSTLKIIAQAGMYHSNSGIAAAGWKNILKSVVKAEAQIKQNVTAKLSLLSLSVSI